MQSVFRNMTETVLPLPQSFNNGASMLPAADLLVTYNSISKKDLDAAIALVLQGKLTFPGNSAGILAGLPINARTTYVINGQEPTGVAIGAPGYLSINDNLQTRILEATTDDGDIWVTVGKDSWRNVNDSQLNHFGSTTMPLEDDKALVFGYSDYAAEVPIAGGGNVDPSGEIFDAENGVLGTWMQPSYLHQGDGMLHDAQWSCELQDGRILFTSNATAADQSIDGIFQGTNSSPQPTQPDDATAAATFTSVPCFSYIYDPKKKTTVRTGDFPIGNSVGMNKINGVRLKDGRVLAAGGIIRIQNPNFGTDVLSSSPFSFLFDPKVKDLTSGRMGKWTQTKDLTKSGQPATTMLGSLPIPSAFTAAIDQYISDNLLDPLVYSKYASVGVDGHDLVLLKDGRVLCAGGGIADWANNFDLVFGTMSALQFVDNPVNAQIFDPKTGKWTACAPMPAIDGEDDYPVGGGGRQLIHAMTFPDGTVLVAGGMTVRRGSNTGFTLDGSPSGAAYSKIRASAITYDPDRDEWHQVGSLLVPACNYLMAMSKQGKGIYVLGGFTTGDVGITDQCSVYTHDGRKFQRVASLPASAVGASARTIAISLGTDSTALLNSWQVAGGAPTPGGSLDTAFKSTRVNVSRFAYASEGAVDGSGSVYFSDATGIVGKLVLSTGVTSYLAGTPYAYGNVDGTGSAAQFSPPSNHSAYLPMVFDNGNLYVGDMNNGSVRKIVVSTGVVTTLTSGLVTGGNPPFWSLTKDGSGNLYVLNCDGGTLYKVVMSTGVTTIIATVQGPTDHRYATAICFASDGNLYASTPAGVLKITTGGVVTDLAGPNYGNLIDGVGAAAWFNWATGIAADGAGNLYVADSQNSAIRKVVISSATVTTVAGGSGAGYADGVGAAAKFNGGPYPGATSLVFDAGNLYIFDTFNYTIRKMVISTATVTTIAGALGIAASVPGPFNPDPGINVFGGWATNFKGTDLKTANPMGCKNANGSFDADYIADCEAIGIYWAANAIGSDAFADGTTAVQRVLVDSFLLPAKQTGNPYDINALYLGGSFNYDYAPLVLVPEMLPSFWSCAPLSSGKLLVIGGQSTVDGSNNSALLYTEGNPSKDVREKASNCIKSHLKASVAKALNRCFNVKTPTKHRG